MSWQARSLWNWVRARALACLLLAFCLGPAPAAEMPGFPLGFSVPGKSNCKPIPHTMTLCHGVGYSEMRLPNLLGHDTMKEVVQQAASWVPLLSKHCHPDTRKFLCSLFAPVCLSELQEAIQPCHSLCRDVRDSCAPVMLAFGFPWPEMLDCHRFPVGNDLCIPSANSEEESVQQEESKICDPCKSEGEVEGDILANYCKTDFGKIQKCIVVERYQCKQNFVKLNQCGFQGDTSGSCQAGQSITVLKVKVKDVVYLNGDARITLEPRSRVLVAPESVDQSEELWLAGGSACTCDVLRDRSASHLVMGHLQGEGKWMVTLVRHWQGSKRDLRRMARGFKKVRCYPGDRN